MYFHWQGASSLAVHFKCLKIYSEVICNKIRSYATKLFPFNASWGMVMLVQNLTCTMDNKIARKKLMKDFLINDNTLNQQDCQKEIAEGLFDQWQHIKLFLDDWLSSWSLPRGIQTNKIHPINYPFWPSLLQMFIYN